MEALSKEEELQRRMQRLGIREEDLSEEFIRGSGAGGQKINKSSVVVQIKHVPSGIVVRSQKTRSQALNRFFARRSLVEKLEAIVLKEKSLKQQQIEKIRRQKRRRSRRAREKMLDAKHFHSLKKTGRRFSDSQDGE